MGYSKNRTDAEFSSVIINNGEKASGSVTNRPHLAIKEELNFLDSIIKAQEGTEFLDALLSWNASTTYPKGACVSYNSKNYVSLSNSNINNTPPTDSNTYWRVIRTLDDRFVKDYSNGTSDDLITLKADGTNTAATITTARTTVIKDFYAATDASSGNVRTVSLGNTSDSTGSYTAVNVYGALVVKGSITSNGVNAQGNYVPSVDNTYVLGSSPYRWQTLFAYTGDFASNINVAGSLITPSSVMNIFNTTATTINLGGAATALNLGASTGTTAIKNNATVAGTLTTTGLIISNNGISGGSASHTSGTFSSTLGVTGLITSSGGISGGAASHTSGTFSSTLDVTGLITSSGGINGGSASHTSGTFSSTLSVASDTTLSSNLAVNGGNITSSASTFNLLNNSNVTTLNIGNYATTLNLGASTGTTSIKNNATIAGTLGVTGVTTVNDLSVTGNLIVNGTSTTINSTSMTLDDPILTLGGDTAPTTDDNKDRGVEFRWHNGTTAKVGFFGYDDSSGAFTFIPDATNVSEVFSGVAGNAVFSAITGTTGTFSSTVTGTSFNSITALSSTTPVMNGTAAVGTSTTVARADHVHASDTSKASLSGATFTGAVSGTTFSGTSFNSITALSSTTPSMNGTAAVGTSTTVARADHVHASDTSKASLSGATFTGAVSGTSFNSITALSSTTPSMNGTAAVGTSTTVARADHVHASDTSKASLSGATFTGAVSGTTFSATTFSGALSGNATTATTLATSRTIGMTGDVSWTSASFNGSGNVSGTSTLASSGVAAGTYGSTSSIPSFTVDSKGRITSASSNTPSGTWEISITGNADTAISATIASSLDVSNAYTAVSFNSMYGFTSINPLVAGNVSTGSSNYVSRSDHVHPVQTSVSGNAGTATKLANSVTINGTTFDGSGNITIPVNTQTYSTSTSCPVPFVTSITAGNQQLYTDSVNSFYYNPSTNVLTAPTFSGALSGNATTATTATNLSGGTVSGTTGTFSSTLTAGGTATFSSTLAVNGTSLTSSSTSFNLLNSSVTTLNIGGAATTIAIGASNSTCTFAGNVTAVDFNSSSDRRLKENIKTIDSALNIVNSLNGVGFNWISNGKKSYGVIAQELEEVIPELVKEIDGVKSVNYDGIVAFLLNAVKELSTEVENLKSLVQK